jgi:hypothetical protein
VKRVPFHRFIINPIIKTTNGPFFGIESPCSKLGKLVHAMHHIAARHGSGFLASLALLASASNTRAAEEHTMICESKTCGFSVTLMFGGLMAEDPVTGYFHPCKKLIWLKVCQEDIVVLSYHFSDGLNWRDNRVQTRSRAG